MACSAVPTCAAATAAATLLGLLPWSWRALLWLAFVTNRALGNGSA